MKAILKALHFIRHVRMQDAYPWSYEMKFKWTCEYIEMEFSPLKYLDYDDIRYLKVIFVTEDGKQLIIR